MDNLEATTTTPVWVEGQILIAEQHPKVDNAIILTISGGIEIVVEKTIFYQNKLNPQVTIELPQEPQIRQELAFESIGVRADGRRVNLVTGELLN